MKAFIRMLFISSLLILSLVALVVTMMAPATSMAAQETVDLGTARNFAILAGTAITDRGTATTTTGGTAGGDVGLSPYAGSYITGLKAINVDGKIYTVDDSGPAGSIEDEDRLTTAKNDLVTAYNIAASRTPFEPTPANLAGETLKPGVYKSDSSIDLAVGGTLILDGENNPNAVFIFQAGSTLTINNDSKVVLINDAQACRVFWQVGSSATLGTDSVFVGHILAMESITANKGATVEGQLLARNGAVELEENVITNDLCYGSLTVSKIVTGDTSGITLEPFEITVTGPGFSATETFGHGDTITWTKLVPGTYTVTENKTDLSSEWEVKGEGSVQVVEHQTAVTTITNSYTPEPETAPVVTAPVVTALPSTGGYTPVGALYVWGAWGAALAALGLFLKRKSR